MIVPSQMIGSPDITIHEVIRSISFHSQELFIPNNS
jgi:hypothetical protein